ncbi:MAG TPA: hypothetical protein PK400_08035 [Phycisphaerales bacterium]|nr:hypothetical protein [Phycisphaerales bacterium]HRQ76380.1 hypothetical protein [Phycisphaerales bacterium]
MIRGVYLNVSEAGGVRDLFRMSGIVGPWCEQEAQDVLTVIEHEGITSICAGTTDGMSVPIDPLGSQAASSIPMPATIVVGRPVGSSATLSFPSYHCLHRELVPKKWPDSERVLVVRETGQTVALAGKWNNKPILHLGFSLSRFMHAVREQHCFFGFGHLVHCLNWWVEKYLEGRVLRISPWFRGRHPALLSFDVEGMVSRRSVGRCVLRLPPIHRPLLEINQLKLIRPLRGKRIICSCNELIDPDGVHTSHRLTFDFRRGRRGCAARHHTITQWQLHFRLPQRPPAKPTDDPGFHDWAETLSAPIMMFYCGGIPDRAVHRMEIGFHGLTHEHFHQMPYSRLREELQSGACLFGARPTLRAIRAPGLLWSDAYFAALAGAGYAVDSSFREISATQPIFPIRTTEGWWELPVTGNLLTLPKLESLITSSLSSGSMLNLHCHDHEVREVDAKKRYTERVQVLKDAGLYCMGHIEFVEWLNRASENTIWAIERISDSRWRAVVDVIPGSAVLWPRGMRCDQVAHEDRAAGKSHEMSVLYHAGRTSLEMRPLLHQHAPTSR